jgi:hypothetical protein
MSVHPQVAKTDPDRQSFTARHCNKGFIAWSVQERFTMISPPVSPTAHLKTTYAINSDSRPIQGSTVGACPKTDPANEG